MDQETFQVSGARILLLINDESKNGPFEVPTGHINIYYQNKSVPNAPNL